MRKIFNIPGGIHPPENKLQSLGKGIRPAGIPARLVLPLAQHIGAPAAPVVAVGDRVLKGQVIAAAKGFVSASCHAPTSGEITAIGKSRVPHPSGMEATCITLVPDGRDEWMPHRGVEDYRQFDKSTLLQLIREAGIAGMGGAGFPTSVKLATDKPIEYLIINGTECEPYITADDALMRERADDILFGVAVLRHIVGARYTLIGIEDNKPLALDIMTQAAAASGIEVVTFPTKYPSGGEKQLIQILTGKEVPSGGLPADVGVVMQNVGTAYAVGRAIGHGEPLLSRITTVTGEAVTDRGNFEVLLGTPVEHLMALCGLRARAVARLIMGGPMMGFTLDSTDVPVVKTTNCILAASRREVPAPAPAQACIRCGLCAQACPASLLPQQLYWFAQGQEYEKLEQHHLFDCIECGCCSYVCPSNIPLVQYYRASKATINTLKRDAIKSEQARERFEARQQRVEREHAEKEARRKARGSKAGSGDDDTGRAAAVEAAIARAAAKKAAPGPAATEPAVADGPQSTIARLEQRLAVAESKYQQVRAQGGDKAEAFALSVRNLQDKLAAARSQAAATGTSPAADADASAPPPAAESAAQQVASLEQRLARAQDKLRAAREQEGAQVEALAQAVATIEQKLAVARQGPAAVPGVTGVTIAADPAQAAIERALAARTGGTAPLSAAQQTKRLQQRLAKARDRYEQARASGDANLDAFAAAVRKLEDQLEQQKQSPPSAHTILEQTTGEDSPRREAAERPVAAIDDQRQATRQHPDG